MIKITRRFRYLAAAAVLLFLGGVSLAAQDSGVIQDNSAAQDYNSVGDGNSSSVSGSKLGDAARAVDAGDRDLRVRSMLDRFETLDNTLPALEVDSNEDGQVDYLIKTNVETGHKMMEVLDYNHDGEMDDFYFYRRGVLAERAIDSNYDGKVDLWVYIEEGVYIAYFERDNDFDGKMDELKRYSAGTENEE